jgi:CRP-like cAMP-binding protein
LTTDQFRQLFSAAKSTSSRFFNSLSEKDILTILGRSRSEEFPSRRWIFREGDPARHLYILESGLVRLSQATAEGEDVLVRLVKPGEVFGYFSVLPVGLNPVACQVIQPSRLRSWDREVAMQLLESYPRAAVNLLHLALHDITCSFERMRRLVTQPVGERVAWAVSELMHAAGVASSAGVVISGGMTQREIADIAATTIFTVSRELSTLERRGLLQKQRNRIVVLQPEKLLE